LTAEEEEAPAAPAPVASAPPAPPVIEPVREEALGWLDTPVETVDADLESFLKAAVPAPEAERPAPPPAPAPRPGTGFLPPSAPAAPTPAPAAAAAPSGEGIAEARHLMSSGNQEGAFNSYEALIGRGQALDDIISDLNEYVGRGKMVNPRAYRLLGDAMMAQGRLQDALEQYRKALDQF
jgi:tetratricopeptide (TPR) repeat protein